MFFLVPIPIMVDVDAQKEFEVVSVNLSERQDAPYSLFYFSKFPRANYRNNKYARCEQIQTTITQSIFELGA